MNLNSLHIRLATPADFRAVNRLFVQVDDHHRALHPELFRRSPAPGRSHEKLTEYLTDPNQQLAVAESPEGIVGLVYLIFKERPDNPLVIPFTYLLIDVIVVDTSIRGQGIGDRLFTYAKGEARKKDIKTVMLRVYESNVEAVKFYEQRGFERKMTQMSLTLED